jgi:hypothetical protein
MDFNMARAGARLGPSVIAPLCRLPSVLIAAPWEFLSDMKKPSSPVADDGL